MRRNTLGVTIAILTFCLGVAASMIWITPPTPSIDRLEEPTEEIIELPQADCFPGLSQTIAEGENPPPSYFPPEAFYSEPGPNQFIVDWYSEHLRAMTEPMLTGQPAESYRFLWLRSFHPPVAIRILHLGEVRLLTVKKLDGAGGYRPGKLVVNRTRPLSAGEWAMFIHLLNQACYWQLSTEGESERGEDGAQWILEGVKEGRYHVVDRWSPETGSYREACLYLLKISGLGIDESSNDLY